MIKKKDSDPGLMPPKMPQRPAVGSSSSNSLPQKLESNRATLSADPPQDALVAPPQDAAAPPQNRASITKPRRQEEDPVGVKTHQSLPPPSRQRYSDTKKQRKNNNNDDSNADMEEPKMSTAMQQPEDDDTSSNALFPGAVRVAGPDAALYQGRSEYTLSNTATDHHDDADFIQLEQQAPPPASNKTFVDPQQQQPTLLEAELVDPNRIDDSVPYASEAVPVQPWKQRLGIVAIVLVVIGITVGIVVPLTSNSSSSNSSNNVVGSPGDFSEFPTISPAPSMVPTTTMAPTSFGLTTIVLQLDSRPQETGWKLDCEGTNIANFPAGVYSQLANRLVTAQFPVRVGQLCTFTILDSGKDGIDDGFFRLHFGPVYASPSTSLVPNTPFTDMAQIEFVMEAPPTFAPTDVPSIAPSTSVEPSYEPTAAPTTPEPTFVPTFIPTRAPTRAPQSNVSFPRPPFVSRAPVFFSPREETFPPVAPPPPPPTSEPTFLPTSEPTFLFFVDEQEVDIVETQVFGEIQFDLVPSETGFTLTCDGVVLQKAASQTFGDPNAQFTFVVDTVVGASCEFEITDDFGDGICCALEPSGFYKLYHGNVADPQNLIAEGGEFEFQDVVEFVAQEPI